MKFKMMTVEGPVEKEILDSFEMHGETWVIHYKNGGFSASHRDTGHGVPRTFADGIQGCKALAMAEIAKQTPEKIAEILTSIRA